MAAIFWYAPVMTYVELSGEHEAVFITTAVMLLIWAYADRVHRESWRALDGVLLGLLTGLGMYVSPVVLPMSLCACAAAAAVARVSPQRLLPFGLSMLAAIVVVVTPYTVRNVRVMHGRFLMRDNLGIEVDVSNNDHARAWVKDNEETGHGMDDHPFINTAEALRVREMGEVAYNAARLQHAKVWVFAHPARFARLVLQRAIYLVFPVSVRWYQRVLGAIVSILFMAGTATLSRAGASRSVALIAGAIAGYGMIYLLVQYDLRYAYPMIFAESLLAGATLATWFGWRPRKYGDTLAMKR